MKQIGLFVVCLALATLLTGSAHAQNRYLDPAENGFLVGGTFSRNEGYTGLGAKIAYSRTGIYGVGLNLDRATNSDNEVISISPFLSALFLRPDEESSLGIEVTAIYSNTNQSRLIADPAYPDRQRDIYSVRGDLFLDLEHSPDLRIFPTIGATYIKRGVSDSDFDLTYGFSVQFLRRFVFDSLAIRGDRETSFTLSLSLLID